MTTAPVLAAVGDVILERRPKSAAVSAARELLAGKELAGGLSERGEPAPLKLVKRHGYGRAKVDLLRRRLLRAA
jgi:hypothetical protein